MTFSANNQPARRRGPALLSRIEKALRDSGREPDALLTETIARAFDKTDTASGSLLLALLGRTSPPLKPTGTPVRFDFPLDGTPADKADSILAAVADGVLSSEDGARITAILRDAVAVREATEMVQRLEAIEASLKGASA